jgi:hypothetical protein
MKDTVWRKEGSEMGVKFLPFPIHTFLKRRGAAMEKRMKRNVALAKRGKRA